MPELPEVQTFVTGLRPAVGRRIRSVDVVDPTLRLDGDRLLGSQIAAIGRRGKNVVLALDPAGDLVIHLRMSGRIRLECPPNETAYTRLILGLDPAGSIYFVNPRRLGTVRLCPDGFDTDLGVDPLDRAFTPIRLAEIAGASGMPIKQLLLDQRRIAGLGNIYAAESLWRARIDPRRPARSLSTVEAETLHCGILAVLGEAIDQLGTTLGHSISDYRPEPGSEGGFTNELAVYGRADDPCKRCGRPIERIVQGGRSTYLCPACQR